MSLSPPRPLTFVYKHVQGVDLSMDVYLPPISVEDTIDAVQDAFLGVPALVYFHGGALTVGNRQSWFPAWLQTRMNASACAFISVDYRLLPPATGHEILADIVDVFRFLDHNLNSHLPGSSSGGLCAYLAAMHVSPKPKVLLSLYGMGGNFLTPQYFSPKTEVFFRGRELLEPSKFSEYLYPSSELVPPIAVSLLAYHPDTYAIPGYPANPRMLLGRLYMQLGVYLDYYTGIHQPSLSAALREMFADTPHNARELHYMQFDDLRSVLPHDELALFPQFGVTKAWPPCLLVHGAADSAVLVHESRHMHKLLHDAGVDVTLRVLAGEEHSLDYQKDAEEKFGRPDGLFDNIADFLAGRLQGDLQ